MHGHAGANDDDAFVAQRSHGLSEPVVRVGVLVRVQAYLNQRNVERIFLGIEGWRC